ncbi:MAG: sensor histidine kinase [Anaerolineales bacterium]
MENRRRRQSTTRVLIADDKYLVGEMIQGLLEDAGYAVVGRASDGEQAIEMTAALRPDVVLMDIRLPGIDGIEATRRIQARCPTPVVALTAYEDLELVEEATQAGIGAYLIKPPDIREIHRAIKISMARFEDLLMLQQMNKALEARNAELDAFAEMVSHDLKNPLGKILGYAELLEMDIEELTGEEIHHSLHTISKNVRTMNNIIQELLLLSRIRDVDEVETGPLDMEKILESVRSRLIDDIEKANVTFLLPDRWPVVQGHIVWVEQVWINYISNGIKYGGSPPRLEVGFSYEHPKLTMTCCPEIFDPSGDTARAEELEELEEIYFWLRDNGAGLKPEEQARLFVPFERLDQMRVEGHGLGLSIVRRIVEQLGGRVGIDSEVGQGSLFWFTLPVA